MVDGIVQRKLDHLDAVLAADVSSRVPTGLAEVQFEHNALPGIDLDDVALGVPFLGRNLRAPIMISSMTGGPTRAKRINETIAAAAQHLGIAFAVGSQRVALESSQANGFDRRLRLLAPDVPILANLGATQLLDSDAASWVRRAMAMIDADAMIIHLNPLQEALQAGGDRRWRGVLPAIAALALVVDVPIVVKEVGSGLSATNARQLFDAGVTILDVAGAGGTSWAAVESQRGATWQARRVAETFRDWGLPTARAVAQVRAACPGTTVIASGGLRNGIDVARCLRIGADLAGFAATVLPAALDGPEALIEHIGAIVEELRIAAFCTGSSSIAALRRAPLQSSPWWLDEADGARRPAADPSAS